MYLIKCGNCGYKLIKDTQIMLYGGEKVATHLAVECAGCKTIGEKKRKLANIFNQYNVKCPGCKQTGNWQWL